MFYQCPKCKKTWQYPIEKCLDCFNVLEKVKSEKIKVVGVSQVYSPTILHPKTPYFVLLLEDENGNRWNYKSLTEYKIGDEFKIKKATDLPSPKNFKEAVAIWRIKYDILEAIEKTIELLGGLKINSNTKILILPTLVAAKHPYLAENTSPEFLESFIKYLLEKGAAAGNIKVAGQSFDETLIDVAVSRSQLLKVCRIFKIMPQDLSKTNFRKIEKEKFSFEVTEEFFNSDIIINMPILKMGQIAGAQNLLRFLKKENYLGLKYLYSDEEIMKNLTGVLKNCFTLAEANTVQKTSGLTIFLGLVFAGFNIFHLEKAFFEATFYNKDLLPASRGLPEFIKNIKIENIPIVGRQIGELKYDVEQYL